MAKMVILDSLNAIKVLSRNHNTQFNKIVLIEKSTFLKTTEYVLQVFTEALEINYQNPYCTEILMSLFEVLKL